MQKALVIAAAAVLSAGSASAQQVAVSGKEPMLPERHASAQMTPRAVMLEDIRRSRENVLKYLDAAPDSMLTFRITPGVRTYAEQLEHAAGATAMIMSSVLKAPRPSLPTDTAAYRRSKPALQAYINASYDAFEAMVRNASDAQLMAEAATFGMTRPGWRWVAGVLDHATWTLGQTVPYLRANGVRPPSYLPF